MNFPRYMARHARGSGGGAMLAFIISFIILIIFTQNIFIAGFFSFIIAAIFAILGG